MPVKTKPARPKDIVYPQSRDDAAHQLARIGDLRRDIAHRKSDASAQINAIGKAVEDALAPLADELKRLEAGLQAFCEDHRPELTQGGKTKHADFATGRVSWRTSPKKVSIAKVKETLANLKAAGLERFIRIKEEPNKEAMLAEPDAAEAVKGITIKPGFEEFSIEPREIDTDTGATGRAA